MKIELAILLVLATPAAAAPRLLALDDVYDCAFAPDGTLVAATAGGLRIGGRVVTALEGLPDTRVESVSFDGEHILAFTRHGTARVSLGGLVIGKEPIAISAHERSTFERYGDGIVRARSQREDRHCIATSDGLYVSMGNELPRRLGTTALPTGDVAALANSSRGVFLGTFDHGLYHFDGAQLQAVDDPALSPHINALAFDAERHLLWVATAKGLVRCEEGAHCRRVGDRHGKHALLLRGDRVIAGGDESIQLFDSSGALAGETTRKNGARFRSVWSLAEANGTIYAGTTSGIFFGDERTFMNAPDQLQRASMVRGTIADDWVTALALDPHDTDTLYAGTYNAGIAVLHREKNSLTLVAADASLGYVNPGGITHLPDGKLAVSTMNGLFIGQFFKSVGAFRSIPTLGADVTAVLVAGPATQSDRGANPPFRWVATRRGVTTF